MANNYYNFTDTFVPGARARSGDVDREYGAIETAFDLLPSSNVALTSGKATWAGTSAGAGNLYNLTMADTRTVNNTGDEVVFIADKTNTAATTLDVDGIGALALVRADGSAMVANDIQSGLIYVARYDIANTRWQLIGPSASYLTDAAASAAAAAVSAAAALVSEGNALTSEGLAAEWASNAVDDDVTGSGGLFSALHWASGAQEWATRAEDSLIPTNFGGDGATDFSAFHWAQKAQLAAADTTQVTGTGMDLPSAPGTSDANLPWRNINNVDWATVGFEADADFTVRNLAHGGHVIFAGESTAGIPTEMLDLDADAGLIHRFNGQVLLDTNSGSGLEVRGRVIAGNASFAFNYDLVTRNNAGGVVLRQASGGTSQINQTNTTGTTQDTWIEMFRDGPVTLFNNNVPIMLTRTGDGISVGGSGAGTYEGGFWGYTGAPADDANYGWYIAQYLVGGIVELENEVPGAAVTMWGRNVGDTAYNQLANLDPDVGATLYYTGNPALLTDVNGLIIRDPDGLVPTITLEDNLAAAKANWTVSGDDVFFQNLTAGGDMFLRANTSESLFRGVQGGAASLYHAGTERIATLATGGAALGTVLELDNSAAATVSTVRGRNSAGGIGVSVSATGVGSVQQLTSAGVLEENWLEFTRNGAVTAHFNGVAAAGTAGAGFNVFDTVGDNPQLHFYQDDLVTRNGYVQFLATGLIIENEVHGTPIRILSEDILGVNQDVFFADGDGATLLYWAGVEVLRSSILGVDIIDPGGDDPALVFFQDDLATRNGFIQFTSVGAIIENEVHGSVFTLRGEDAGGVNRNILTGDPDNATSLYDNGVLALTTTPEGIDVHGAVSALLDVIAGTASNDAILGLRGTTNGGMRVYWDESASAAFLRQTTAAGVTEDVWISLTKNGAVTLYYDGVIEGRTADSNEDHRTSGLLVNDHGQVQRDVGFNVMPVVESDATRSFAEDDVGKMMHRDAIGSVTFTLASGTSGAVPPVGATIMITNENATGTVTISAAGTLRHFAGAGAPATGNRTLGEGGVCTAYKYASTEWWIWGSGIS